MTHATAKNSLNTLTDLQVGNRSYGCHSLPRGARQLGDLERLPFSLKVLLENLLRNADDETVSRANRADSMYKGDCVRSETVGAS